MPHLTTPHTQQARCPLKSHFRESMQGKCYKIYLCEHPDILGGKDDTQLSLQVQQNQMGERTAGAALAVERFQTNVRREHFIGEKLKTII